MRKSAGQERVSAAHDIPGGEGEGWEASSSPAGGPGAATARQPIDDERQAETFARQRAAFGDLAALAMQHPAYRNFAIADLDWLIAPAVITGNFLLASTRREDGVAVPLAAITWARVSEDVDARLMENPQRPFRLSPQEYMSGDIYWLAHTFGPPEAVEALIKAATQQAGETEDGRERPAGPLAGKKFKQRTRDDSGRVMVVEVG